jgi:high-affinity nickel permease
MKIHFKIHFITKWGQTVILLWHQSDNEQHKVLSMQFGKNSEWSVELTVDNPLEEISYQYAVQNPDHTLFYEYGKTRKQKFLLLIIGVVHTVRVLSVPLRLPIAFSKGILLINNQWNQKLT